MRRNPTLGSLKRGVDQCANRHGLESACHSRRNETGPESAYTPGGELRNYRSGADISIYDVFADKTHTKREHDNSRQKSKGHAGQCRLDALFCRITAGARLKAWPKHRTRLEQSAWAHRTFPPAEKLSPHAALDMDVRAQPSLSPTRAYRARHCLNDWRAQRGLDGLFSRLLTDRPARKRCCVIAKNH